MINTSTGTHMRFVSVLLLRVERGRVLVPSDWWTVLLAFAAAALLGRFLTRFAFSAGLSLWLDSVSGGRDRAAPPDLDFAAGSRD